MDIHTRSYVTEQPQQPRQPRQPRQPQQPQQQQASIPSVPILFVCVTFHDGLQRVALHRRCSAAQAATTALVVATRAAAVDRCGLGPRCNTTQGQNNARAGEEDIEVHFMATIRANPLPQAAGTEHFSLDVEDPTRPAHARVWSAGASSAVHRSGSRCSCAAVGGPVYWAGLRRTASSHWWTFLMATETGSPCLRLSSPTDWLSFQLFFEAVHTGQTVQKTAENPQV